MNPVHLKSTRTGVGLGDESVPGKATHLDNVIRQIHCTQGFTVFISDKQIAFRE